MLGVTGLHHVCDVGSEELGLTQLRRGAREYLVAGQAWTGLLPLRPAHSSTPSSSATAAVRNVRAFI